MDAANEEQLTEQQKSDQLEPEADIRPEQDKQTDKRQIEEPEKLTPREMAEKMSSALSKDKKGATEQEKMVRRQCLLLLGNGFIFQNQNHLQGFEESGVI